MIFSIDNVDDLYRYYHGTFVTYPELNPERPNDFYVVSTAGPSVLLKNLRTKNETLFDLTKPGSTIEFTYILPGKTLVQTAEGVMLLSRKLDKQYKRGLSNENATIYKLVKAGSWIQVSPSNTTVLDFQKSQEEIPQVGDLKSITSAGDRHAVRLSDYVCAHRDGSLWVYHTNVGMVNLDKNTAFVNPLFFNEVRAALPSYVRLTTYRAERKFDARTTA